MALTKLIVRYYFRQSEAKSGLGIYAVWNVTMVLRKVIFMSVTTSFHCGSTVSFLHNARDPRVCSKEAHIDMNGEHSGSGVGYNGETLRYYYDMYFGEATAAYNAKQKRSDRMIDSYYDKIKAEQERGERTGNKNAKKLVYEAIMGVGGFRNYNKEYAAEALQIDTQEAKAILHEASLRIQDKTPHLKCVGIYYHNDEYHIETVNGRTFLAKGAPHVHFDFVPVADGLNRGMSVQNALTKALEQDGFVSRGKGHTAQMAFQEFCLGVIDEVCMEHGLDVEHPIRDGNEEKRRFHLSKQELRAQELDGQVKKQEEQLARMALEAQNLASEASLAQANIKDLATAAKEAQSKLKELEAKKDAMTDSIAVERSNFASERSSAEADIAALEKEKTLLEANLAELEKNVTTRNAALAKLPDVTEKLKTAERELRHTEKLHDSLSKEIDGMEDVLNAGYANEAQRSNLNLIEAFTRAMVAILTEIIKIVGFGERFVDIVNSTITRIGEDDRESEITQNLLIRSANRARDNARGKKRKVAERADRNREGGR